MAIGARVVGWLGISAVLVGGLAGCGGDDTAGPGEAAVEVVATTTMLGDVVGDLLGCAGGSVTTLMPPGADPHDFAPSSAQVTDLVRADLVVANGLGLEEGLADALASARADGARVLEVAPLVDPIEFGSGGDHADDHGGEGADTHGDEPADAHPDEDGHAEGDAHGDEAGGAHADEHAHGSLDPHFWLDAGRMASAAEAIAAELGKLTGRTDEFARCGAEVADALRATDAEVRDILAAVPADRRVLVTDHDAFGYFAKAYDFEVAGVVVPGGSTLAQPSSAELADLVSVIRAEQVPAIFSNAAVSPALVETVATEVGTPIGVVELYVGSLGPAGSGADTYAGMMKENAKRIAAALAG